MKATFVINVLVQVISFAANNRTRNLCRLFIPPRTLNKPNTQSPYTLIPIQINIREFFYEATLPPLQMPPSNREPYMYLSMQAEH